MQHISQRQIDEETQRFFQKVYMWMFTGLLVSGVTAYNVGTNPNWFALVAPMIFPIIIVELALVIGLFFFIKKMPATLAGFFFYLYSFTTGLTLSVIFLIYKIQSIFQVFFIAAAMFAIMSIYGYVTKKDLTKMGQLLIMALIGIVIAGVVNIFLKSSALDFITAIIGVIVFTGLTAYDTQKIKKMNIIGNEGTQEDTKEAIIGALRLYLDFINLFLKLLRLLGKRK